MKSRCRVREHAVGARGIIVIRKHYSIKISTAFFILFLSATNLKVEKLSEMNQASRNLKVGLTALKKKCRELGIPRWPHRKIKSLDSLIHNLQEEAKRQKQEDDDAAAAVLKRQRMLEKEKETIESKPSMEIQSETKRFRQDVFKRRHRSRALQTQDT